MYIVNMLKKSINALNCFKYAVLATLSMLILVFVVIGKLYPVYEEHLLIEQKCQGLEKKLEALEQFASNHRDYKKIKEKHLTALARLREKLPESIDSVNTMGMQQVAKKQGISLNTRRIEKRENRQATLVSTGLELKATGSYPDIIGFLDYLESSSLTGLENISIEVASDNKLAVSGKCYYYAMKLS